MWPWWLQRQLDLGSPAWQPADLAGHNRTGRNWTIIGIPDGDDRWLVDRRGLLAPSSGHWALDWWVGAEDRWRLPSREASVRQRLVGDAPVLETALRVPGGEVVARHWALPGDDADLVVLEIENASAAPVAVALSVRPVGPAGPTGGCHVAVEGGRLVVDGATVLRAAVRPSQSLVSDAAGGDVAVAVTANATPAAHDADLVCPAGWASAVMVWPLAHRASLRAESPGRVDRPSRKTGAPPRVRALPRLRAGPTETAQGWTARTTRLTRLELPPGPLTSALEAQRRHLLIALPIGGGEGEERLAEAQVVAALSTAGLRTEARRRLETWLGDQHRGGRFGPDVVTTASTLVALQAWVGTGDDDGLAQRAPVAVARAAEHIDRAPPPPDPVAAAWAVAGLKAAARLLARTGEVSAAAQARHWARGRSEALLASLAPALRTAPGEAGPGDLASALRTAPGEPRPGDLDPAPSPEVAGTLQPAGEATEAALLATVLGVLPATHAVARAGRFAARRSFTGLPAGAVWGPTPMLGLRPELSLQLAAAAALAGEDPFDPLRWVLSVASPTWTWPTIVDPRLGTGSHGSGHDPVVAAALWTCGRGLLVADPILDDPVGAPPHLDLLPAPPPEWLGQGIEVHGLATSAGSLSYAIRWHGDRPAVLWEIAGEGPSPTVTTGLDRAWRGGGRRGEALLGAVPGPEEPS